jgi:LuxR family transcriptional regulator, maltose regulon positive regulatory protein
MQKADPLIRTKLRLPFTRPGLVSRPRLQEQIAQGLRGPLTLITAPAGFGKTTLVSSCIAGYGRPVNWAWLSLDKDDNQTGRFLSYLIAAVQEADRTVGSEAVQLLAAARQAPPEAVLTSLINDLDRAARETVLVLDDYQFIRSQAIHDEVAFLLEHCPKTFHLVIASRSDPPLPIARLRARSYMIELRAADLRFTRPEAGKYLNDVMGLRLDAGSVTMLEERTEGWIAGLQMAALSMRDREDVIGFIEGFSGTNRYILDYLLEEVLASQPPEIQRFLLYTSILDRLTAPLCEAVLDVEKLDGRNVYKYSATFQPSNPLTCQQILEYLERANIFLVPLDDERIWYRYHHLFADLLRAQLQRCLNTQGVAQLHARASEWHAQNGSALEAIHHASMASDDEQVERLIEQNYMEMVNRGEMSWLRFWTGKLSKELVYRRPWLCIYEAQNHAWFGELDEADRLLEEAEKRIPTEISAPDAKAMLGHLTYVRSRVTAMRGDIHRAIALCLEARELIPTGNLALHLDIRMTLGYEYFLNGDYGNASPSLHETIRSGRAAGSIINIVAAHCVIARLYAVQGLLKKSYDLYQIAAQLIPDASGRHLGAKALVEVGIADVHYEWNDLDTALVHLKQGLALMPWWGKADDFVLAYITLARIHLAQGNKSDAAVAVEKALQIIQTSAVFSEARRAVEVAQVKLWLAQGDLLAAQRWSTSLAERLSSDGRFGFDNELAHITRGRVLIAQHKPNEAIGLCSHLEETAQAAGRMGRVIEILLLEALALREIGDSVQAVLALTKCLTLAEPERYVRVFLDEGRPSQMLLAQWLAHAGAGPLREYVNHLLSQFNAETHAIPAMQESASPTGDSSVSSGQALVEHLSQRELEVLHLIALGRTNQEIAQQLIVSPGTIKAHTASIYRKLDVANRTEAAARARQLGFLP